MILKKTPVALSAYYQEFIKTQVLTTDFPWFRAPYQTENPIDLRVKSKVVNAPFFSHVLMRRSENQGLEGQINSQYFQHFRKIFLDWCEENAVKVNTIYRACVNLTLYADGKFTVPHKDHDFFHYNWIMYLNNSSAHTLIFDENLEIVERIKPEENTCVLFDGSIHAHELPSGLDQRMVVVFTFD